VGRAIALELGRLGAKVAVLGRRRHLLEETVALLADGVAVPADVRKPSSGPLAGFGTEAEIANACAYLVSDYAAYVTGDVLAVDGGAWLEQGMFR
jgi:NAD(P)-dependent dehydrogenase (short-subunit alcohol dehydrogenase family)